MDPPLYALLEPGSEISGIKYKTAALLNLHGRVERVSTKIVDGESKAADREIVNFDIVSRDGHSSFGIVNAHVMDTFNLHKQSLNLTSLTKQWPHLTHVPVHPTSEEEVAVLIGQDQPAAIEIFETRKDSFNQRYPRAYLTAFGWCIRGPIGQPTQSICNYHLLSFAEERL
jgi:hypothetical protein